MTPNKDSLLRYLGKILVGLITAVSIILLALFAIGYFKQQMDSAYLENNGTFMLMLGLIALVFSPFAWKWRKDIWDNVVHLLIPF